MRLRRSWSSSAGAGACAIGLIVAGLTLPATATAAVAPGPQGPQLLPNTDVRAGAKPVATPATAKLERSLGVAGFVDFDPETGGVSFVGRTDGRLTGPSDASPTDIVRDYVSDNARALGLTAADLTTMDPGSSYTSIDGVTHVTFTQGVAGIESYDTYLRGNVDKQGRLINLSGSAVTDLSPNTTSAVLSADEALLAARADVGGDATVPVAKARARSADRATTYETYAESARLTVFAGPGEDRLAWKVLVLDSDSLLYQVAVDATTGEVLARQSLTAFDSNDAQIWSNHPSKLQVPTTVNFGTDPTWLDRSAANGNQLIGNNAHAYHDDNGTNGYQAGEEVVRNPGTNTWTHPMTWFTQGECPAAGCTWDSTNAATKVTNRAAGTVGMFYLANHFHDHLLKSPIGFDEASGNFEQVNASGQGLGGDPVLAEAQDSSGTNNANFATPPDGAPGRMQMFLWAGNGPAAVGPQHDVDGSPSAEVVYHEYAHGLSGRLIGDGAGLGAFQSGAMGEGWSDFYALDLLVAEGAKLDPAGSGDVWMGESVTGVPGIFGGISRIRHQAIDCAVGADAAKCPSNGGTAGTGGYTFGDLGKVGTTNSVHDGGEIWSQTMWDLRTALGRTDALKIITGGMRLSPSNPSMLQMRDAILQAASVNGVSRGTVWQVFAARGFGYFASTASADATTANEDFTVPTNLVHVATVVDDNAPRGDGDGVAEPGETLAVTITLNNPTGSTIAGATGTASAIGATVTRGDSAWPSVGPGDQGANDPSFAVTIPDTAICGADVALSVAASSPAGAITIPSRVVAVGSPAFTAAADVPKAIPDNLAAGVDSIFALPGSGTVSDLDVKIGSLAHPWVGDLRITLTHGGTTVVLTDRPGAGTYGSAGDDFVDLVFDDEASSPIEGIGTGGPFTGSFVPDQSLAAFDGQPLSGDWTLNVSDNSAQDTGTLQAWGLSPAPQCDVFALPVVTSQPASAVTTSSAVLKGSLDANGHATDYRFDYGTTMAYGASTPVTSGGSGADPVAVSAALPGLNPSTDYHFRIVALRGGVEVGRGGDLTFRTADVPPVVTTPPATPPTTTPTTTPTTPPPAALPTPRVKASPVSRKGKLKVDVNPNLGKGYWKFQVQRQNADGTWTTLARTYKTLGKKETRTINLKKGIYRAVTQPRTGHGPGYSTAVQLKR